MKVRLRVVGAQLTVVIVVIGAWQYLPGILALRQHSHIFDPYFVSSPSRIAIEMYYLFVGHEPGVPHVWTYLWPTLAASFLGTLIGMVLGALLGLVLSNFAFMSSVLRPFVIAVNATPRIALIPVIVLLLGTTLSTSVVSAVLVVFFVAFFNAYEGGTTISPALINNASLLGASRWQLLRSLRGPYVLAWTFASLPLAITFSVITVVTCELLTGYPGMGFLLESATSNSDSTLTFATTIILSVVGLAIVMGAELLRNRVLHWWGK
jgi:NitT/TauT family transport system permease protein